MTAVRRALPSAVAGSILLIATAVARRGVPAWERQTYAAINSLPDSIAPLAWPPMQFGSFPSPFVLGALFYRHSRRSEPATSLIAAGVTAWLVAKAVKKLVGRGRPHDFDPQTNLRLWTEVDGSLGFVSGHAAVAMASARIIQRNVSPQVAAGVYGLAVIVALSRIYTGAHLPIDAVGGAALGMLIAEGVRELGPYGPGRTWAKLPDSE